MIIQKQKKINQKFHSICAMKFDTNTFKIKHKRSATTKWYVTDLYQSLVNRSDYFATNVTSCHGCISMLTEPSAFRGTSLPETTTFRFAVPAGKRTSTVFAV